MAEPTKRIMFSQVSGMGLGHPDVAIWLGIQSSKVAQSSFFEMQSQSVVINPRISMSRNIIAKDAIDSKIDYVVMIDPDMRCDLYLEHIWGNQESKYGARAFLETCIQVVREEGPCVIASPASGSRPNRAVNVWFHRGVPGGREKCTHEEANERMSNPRIEQVAAIGTGLIFICTEIFRLLPQPFFDDVYWDISNTDLKLSQDVYFTSQCDRNNVPVFCNWYSWAGHHKTECLGVPVIEEAEDGSSTEDSIGSGSGDVPMPVKSGNYNSVR